MIQTQVRPYYRNKVNQVQLIKFAQAVLDYEGKSGNATIVVTGNQEIRSYNLSYRNMDAPTDVLSFCDGSIDPETGEYYLGDIIISFMKARQQAQAEQHPVQTELALLTVHGMLHLLGYDHQTKTDRKTMWDRQAKVLANLGFDMTIFSELEQIG